MSYVASAFDDQQIKRLFEVGLSLAATGRSRPDEVDEDVWASYLESLPHQLLNLSMIGLLQGKMEEAMQMMTQSSDLFEDSGNPNWILGRVISQSGVLTEKDRASALKTASSLDRMEFAPREPVYLLHLAVARNYGPKSQWADQINSIRSPDRQQDERLASLRAIAGKDFADIRNLTSVRILIRKAVELDRVPKLNSDEFDMMLGIRPLLDPTTLTASALVFGAGGLAQVAFERQSGDDLSWSEKLVQSVGRHNRRGVSAYLEVLRRIAGQSAGSADT